MSSPLDLQRLLKLPADFLEAGIQVLGGGARVLQGTLEAISGQGAQTQTDQAPLNGPRSLDEAFAEFANHLVRIGRTASPGDAQDMMKTAREAWDAARRSFGYIDASDPRALALCLAAPLSAGGMMAEAAHRALVFFSILGPRKFPKSTLDFIETTSDIAPFVRLQYKELIDRHKQRLQASPNAASTRRDLARIYMKCGRYSEAVDELRIAAKDPSVRAGALYDSCVAQYRQGKPAQAIEDGVAAMTADNGNERARYWMWLSSQKLGGYPETVPARFRMDMRAGQAPTALRYENIAAKIGLNKTSGGRGTAVFDYNNDGLLDIAITSAHGGTSLYRNNGDGTFTDVSIDSGLDQAVNGFSIIAGDYDNDGFVDLYISRLGWYAGEGALFHNNGDGTFTDVTEKAGVQTWGPCFSASWVDYNCDGYLDLFVPNNTGGVFDRHLPNRLFRNNGDGTFTDVTAESGVGSVLPAIGSAWGDYNNDGFPDLFVSGMGHPQLYRNNGDGTFTDVSSQAGLTDAAIGTVCAWCDYDNDGWLDIAQFVWSDYEDIIQTMKSGIGPVSGKPMRIFHNNRNGTFTKHDFDIGLDGCWGSMSGTLGDLDNDGNIDFVLGNGAPPMDRIEPLIVLQHDGRKYRNVTFSAGLPFTGKSHGANVADLFSDGRLSILVASGGLYPGDLLTSAVFCPTERLGNYLNVRLTGVKCNRDAIGARITLEAGGRKQMREVSGGTNFGCLPTEQHFGLGDLTEIESIQIRWPDGELQRVHRPPVNATIRIVQGVSGFEPLVFTGGAARPGLVESKS